MKPRREINVGFDAAKGKPQVMAPSEKEMLNFLAGQGLPKDQEIYLRMRLLVEGERFLEMGSKTEASLLAGTG